MRPNFRPFRGFVVFLLLVSLTTVALTADKKRKSAEPAAASNAKAKSTQKSDSKQQAKASRESDKKNDQNKQRLAHKKKNDDNEKPDKKSGVSKVVAKQREADNRKTAKNAKPEAEKKNEKTNDKLARREQDKKAEKKEIVAKKQPSEKATKHSAKPDTKSELVAAKARPGAKSTKPETQSDAISRIEENKKSKRDLSADNSKSLAKLETRAKLDSKPEPRYQAREEKMKELPSVKFALRPIAKVIPRVELKFSVARAVAGNSFDAPPPRDDGPDVIDVIEHDSPEAGRLDDVLRSEMKTLQFSGVPSNSRKRMDVGKMDAERIKQIQEALAKKGYYAGEISGQYDDTTIEAMRKFQETHKVDVTGYATAQSLRLLGLTDW